MTRRPKKGDADAREGAQMQTQPASSGTNGHGDGEDTKKKILDTLRTHPEGLTIIELSETIGVHRQTVAKYILVLEAMDLVHRRRLGSATLHYLKETYFRQIKESEAIEKIRKKL
jgi:DNA-binding transcriptional ArsR family regulator